MKSAAETVKTYIEGQPDEWRPTLRRLRALCRRELAGYEEDMSYGMPSYSQNGKVAVAFAKQSEYLSLYILAKPVLDAHRAELTGLSVGKGCIRFRRAGQLDWALVGRLLSESRSTSAPIC
ncbi:MAG: iron chaperone [Acidimicrobiales bacterium]